MNKPYNRYVENEIKAFMNLIFKYGYNCGYSDAIYDNSEKD